MRSQGRRVEHPRTLTPASARYRPNSAVSAARPAAVRGHAPSIPPRGHREDRRVNGLPRDFQRVEQDRGEELDIGVERPVRIFPPQRRADMINMKKSGSSLSAREAAAELAISPATLYAYVSRGLVRSEPSPDSRSHRYRAEDIRGLKARRTPSPEPRGLKNFDADLPVMDRRFRPSPRTVRSIAASTASTLPKRHARTCRDAVVGCHRRRPVRVRQLSASGGNARHRRRRAAPRRSIAPSPCWRWPPAPTPGRSPAPPTGAPWLAGASCGW